MNFKADSSQSKSVVVTKLDEPQPMEEGVKFHPPIWRSAMGSLIPLSSKPLNSSEKQYKYFKRKGVYWMNQPIWSVNLEHGERWWYAHVIELPGCFTRGPTREMVLSALPQAITEHLACLKRRGQKPSAKTREFRIIEEITMVPELGEAGGAVALFSSDLEPLTQTEFTQFLHLMEWNREDLLTLIKPLTEANRAARPISTKWTINETLQHIANAEEWYISRLGRAIQSEYERLISQAQRNREEKSLFKRLAEVRRAALQVLRKAFSQGVPSTFTRAAYTSHPHERWTFRKVLRRFVEHEREHLQVIEQLIDALNRSR